MKKRFLNSSLVVLIFCLMLCSKVFSQDYYSIVADSCDDSLFCARNNPIFDFETQGIITGTTIPDHNVTLRHGSMNQLQEAIKLLLNSTFGYSIQGIPVSFYIVVDTLGVARGVIVNISNPVSIVSLSAARVVFDFLKTKNFIPASLRGKPVISGFPVVYRIRNDLDFDTISSPPESWPSYNNDAGVSKKTKPIDCLKSQDTIPSWSLITIVESMPSFDNDKDFDKLSEIIQSNLIGLDTITICKTIYIELLVDTIGNTHNHKVLNPTNSILDEEALRVCRLVKFDHPAMQRGHPVSIKYVLPVKFEPKRTIRQKTRHCFFKGEH